MEEYIKAKVKVTGDTLYVKPCMHKQMYVPAYQTKDGHTIAAYALEFEKETDWEQRRYEIAKEMMPCAWNDGNGVGHYEECAKEALLYADALIEELKKNNN